jgi:hypothetical protein
MIKKVILVSIVFLVFKDHSFSQMSKKDSLISWSNNVMANDTFKIGFFEIFPKTKKEFDSLYNYGNALYRFVRMHTYMYFELLSDTNFLNASESARILYSMTLNFKGTPAYLDNRSVYEDFLVQRIIYMFSANNGIQIFSKKELQEICIFAAQRQSRSAESLRKVLKSHYLTAHFW